MAEEETMTPFEFDADLRREGYQIMNTSLAPNQLNPDHTHDFDARIMVLAGEITITRDLDEPTGAAAALPNCVAAGGER
jgi:quercetin dioxygenase-like cupin family protein